MLTAMGALALPGWTLGYATPAPVWRFPEDRVGYAIGDVHGRADLLAILLDKIEADARASRLKPLLVMLGDYVDRGPDSRGVIEMLASGRPHGFERRFLKGNHEQAMLAFLDKPHANRPWLELGGLQTIVSYGLPAALSNAADAALQRVAADLRAALPESHLAFLKGLERYAVYGDYLFVHAGVDPAKPLAAQTDTDLFWIRDRFLKAFGAYTHCVVHGHTPQPFAYVDERRIGVDTGAYALGTLTAVRLEAETTSFISASAT
ncbi:MAG: metallophosphoesterase family protein [Hyphomonadaceae bacterium]|nr:metallophosphoesterase family protein [Hyphomonadaceae bacterium]